MADAIASARDICDEIIIVVDSSSSDGTLEWVKEQADQDKRFRYWTNPWPNSFADQRNFALEKATRDWILFIDADERLEIKDHGKITQALKEDVSAYEIDIRNYTHDFSEMGFVMEPSQTYPYGFVRTTLHRLFRRDPRIRYDGILHERIEPSLSEHNLKTKRLNAVIHHLGKLKETSLGTTQERHAFYEDLGRKKVRQHPFDGQAHWELGVVLQKQGKLAEAEGEFLRALELSPQVEEFEVYFLLSLYQQKAWTRILHAKPSSPRGKFFEPLARAEMDPEAIDELLKFADLYSQAPLMAFEIALRKNYLHKIERARLAAFKNFESHGIVEALEGSNLRTQGKFGEALPHLKTALHKSYWPAFKDLSICLLKLKNPKDLLAEHKKLPPLVADSLDTDVKKMLRLAELSS